MNTKPTLGVTLYSFTNDWQLGRFTFAELIAEVARLGLGPAVEVVGFQSFRNFLDVPDDFARDFRNLLEKHGLTPSCLGGNCDVGRRRDRAMTQDEIVAYLERQIISAQKLGFPVLRIQAFVGPAVFERLAPIAEKAGVHVACELHSPLSTNHPEVVALRQVYERTGSTYIGFIPDFSPSMNHPPERYWESLRRDGAPEALIDDAKAIWMGTGANPEKFAALAEAAARHSASPLVAGRLNTSMTMFGHMPVERWADLLPYTHHIHGKFYKVDETGNETSISYPEIMALLKKTGYNGTISAEWEGHAFTGATLGFEQVRRWHAMCKRLLN